MEQTSKKRVHIIAAVGKNNAIGKNNGLLWRIPSDLKRFKMLTLGHPIIMGRKTHESIGKALPGRTNIIITGNPTFQATDCTIVPSLDEALRIACTLDTDAFIIGGGQVYREALPRADVLHLTVVDDSPEADTFFPAWYTFGNVTEKQETVDETSKLHLTFLTIEKSRTP